MIEEVGKEIMSTLGVTYLPRARYGMAYYDHLKAPNVRNYKPSTN
jgi:hypothetical protein